MRTYQEFINESKSKLTEASNKYNTDERTVFSDDLEYDLWERMVEFANGDPKKAQTYMKNSFKSFHKELTEWEKEFASRIKSDL